MSPLRLIAAALACLALVSALRAQTPPIEVPAPGAACDALLNLTPANLAPATIEEVQLGLLHAFQDSNENSRLSDETLGRHTRNRLRELCIAAPRADGQNPTRETLDAAVAYARLHQATPGWAERLSALDLGDPPEALALRLAAGPAMASMALGRISRTYDCASPAVALSGFAAAEGALATLSGLYPSKTAQEICEMMPVAGGIDAWQQAMQTLGGIEADFTALQEAHEGANRRASALDLLHREGFIGWLAEGSRGPEDGSDNRLRRLVGTVPVVLALIEDYRAEAGDQPRASGACAPSREEATLTYYSLQKTDVAELDFLLSITPKLDAFRTEQGSFDNPQALWQALRPVLAEDLDDCILAEIETLVKGPDRLPLAFLIRPAAVDALMAEKELETALPVLTDLAPLRMGSRADFVARIRADLQDVQDDMILAEVTAAANTLAAASEPVPPVTDSPLLEIEEIEDAPEPAPLITVTDATDQAMQTAIDNPELEDTLRNTPMVDATVPELIRSQVRAALEETARRQAQEKVDRQIALIEPAITSEWTLTEALQREILALTYVQSAISDPTADGAVDRLAPLIGVSYPSLRLFGDALRTVSLETGKVPFSAFVSDRIVQKAQKTVPVPQAPRRLGPLAIEDCNCAPERQGGEDPLQVYGFYPFWLAPTLADVQEADAIAKGTAEPDDSPPQELQQVNFGTVDRIAFYGLEFQTTDDGRATLVNKDHWRDAKRSFVTSAHQYRARADLAFDLRDWTRWDVATIDEVVEDIATEMAPFERIDSFEPGHLAAALPALFDRPQPDGVTLIFHDYEGADLGAEEMKTMIRIIKSVYEGLPNRDDLDVNVAFDFPLVEEVTDAAGAVQFAPILDKPVFDALYELLQERPYVLANEDASDPDFNPEALGRERKKIINKILLFLERPTTDAKKGLRFRMEQGLFQGELRRQVLRSIIPVIPPAGHREVRTAIKPNDPDQSPRDPFSQLEDDVVYFKDNFSGIGFWPVPAPVTSAAAKADPELATETAQINLLIATHFNEAPPLLQRVSLPGAATPVCTYACPNRARIMLAAMALFALLVLLTWRSFYSGIVHRLAFRFMTIGVVWIGNLVLLGTLFVLANCDPHSAVPDALMWALLAALGLLLIAKSYQRLRDGPMP